MQTWRLGWYCIGDACYFCIPWLRSIFFFFSGFFRTRSGTLSSLFTWNISFLNTSVLKMAVSLMKFGNMSNGTTTLMRRFVRDSINLYLNVSLEFHVDDSLPYTTATISEIIWASLGTIQSILLWLCLTLARRTMEGEIYESHFNVTSFTGKRRPRSWPSLAIPTLIIQVATLGVNDTLNPIFSDSFLGLVKGSRSALVHIIYISL